MVKCTVSLNVEEIFILVGEKRYICSSLCFSWSLDMSLAVPGTGFISIESCLINKCNYMY